MQSRQEKPDDKTAEALAVQSIVRRWARRLIGILQYVAGTVVRILYYYVLYIIYNNFIYKLYVYCIFNSIHMKKCRRIDILLILFFSSKLL